MSESAKPLSVDGVTVQPKWHWSDQYRSEVRDTLTATTPAERERRMKAEMDYLQQWAERRGLPFETDADIEAVRERIRAGQASP